MLCSDAGIFVQIIVKLTQWRGTLLTSLGHRATIGAVILGFHSCIIFRYDCLHVIVMEFLHFEYIIKLYEISENLFSSFLCLDFAKYLNSCDQKPNH